MPNITTNYKLHAILTILIQCNKVINIMYCRLIGKGEKLIWPKLFKYLIQTQRSGCFYCSPFIDYVNIKTSWSQWTVPDLNIEKKILLLYYRIYQPLNLYENNIPSGKITTVIGINDIVNMIFVIILPRSWWFLVVSINLGFLVCVT